eukprot:353596-Chlamydomonas_euryale.AAC.8
MKLQGLVPPHPAPWVTGDALLYSQKTVVQTWHQYCLFPSLDHLGLVDAVQQKGRIHFTSDRKEADPPISAWLRAFLAAADLLCSHV